MDFSRFVVFLFLDKCFNSPWKGNWWCSFRVIWYCHVRYSAFDDLSRHLCYIKLTWIFICSIKMRIPRLAELTSSSNFLDDIDEKSLGTKQTWLFQIVWILPWPSRCSLKMNPVAFLGVTYSTYLVVPLAQPVQLNSSVLSNHTSFSPGSKFHALIVSV